MYRVESTQLQRGRYVSSSCSFSCEVEARYYLGVISRRDWVCALEVLGPGGVSLFYWDVQD